MSAATTKSDGFAIVTALWAALILAIVVSFIVRAGRTDARIANTAMRQVELRALADAAIALVELRLIGPGGARGMPLDGSPFLMAYAGHRIQVRIQDQAGLIDLNFAGGDTLNRLFGIAARLDQAAAQTLVDRVLDWREPGAGRRLNGAKAPDYAEAGYSYSPRQGPFESVAELRLVLGVTPTTFDRVAQALTVYSQKALIDPEVAPEIVLTALPGMNPESASVQIKQRKLQREESESNTIQQLPLAGRCMEIAVTSDGQRIIASTVIRLTDYQNLPVWTYRYDF